MRRSRTPKEISEAPTALFDMDGTLADFDGALQSRMDSITSPSESVWNSENERQEPLYITQRRRLIKSVPGFWFGLPELEDGFWILEQAVDIGFRIMVLSKGPTANSLAWKEKIDWCRAHILGSSGAMDCDGHGIDHEITLTEDKGLVYGRLLVDDWPDYALRWLEFRPRGLVIMPARRWNKDLHHKQVLRFELGSDSDEIACRHLLREAFNRK